MPNRVIKESIRTSDTINELSWFEEVLFYRLIVSCDDYGRFDGRPAIIKGTLFPLKEGVTTKNIESALSRLTSAGLVKRYVVDGKPYLSLPTWEQHQTIRAKRSKFPGPDEGKNMEDDCNMKASENICKHMQADAPENPNPDPNPNPNPNTGSEPAPAYSEIVDSFNEICKSFPKVKALTENRRKAIRARLRTHSAADFITLFEKAEASDFLRGANGRDWSATFDWLIKESNMEKVLEGNYDNKKSSGSAASAASKGNRFHNFQERDYDYDSLEAQLLGGQKGGPGDGT